MSASPVQPDGADLLLAIRLTPKAARTRIGGSVTDAQGKAWLQASVTAPPERGKANDALIALLATTLALPRSSIFLETGDTNRLKRVRIIACPRETAEHIQEIATKERNAS